MSLTKIIFHSKHSLLQIYVFLRDYQNLEECLKSKELDVNNDNYVMCLKDDVIPVNGWTPLHVCASINDLKSAEILLRFGADINAKTGVNNYNLRIESIGKYTALHIAIKYGNQEFAQMLIQMKANLNLKDLDGITPLEMCLKSTHLSKLLIESGADYKSKHFDKYPLIFRAIDSKNLSLIKYLAEKQTKSVFFEQKSPIEYAITEFPECVSALIATGKQIHFPNQETGEYLIHLMVRMKKIHWIKELCEKGFNLKLMDRYRNGALHIAVKSECSKSIVLLLISFGANPNLKNYEDYTPITYAIQSGNEELTEILLNNGSRFSPHWIELERAINNKKFKMTSILLKKYELFDRTFDPNLRFDSEPILFYFVKHCVGEQGLDDTVIDCMTQIMQKLIDSTSSVNRLDPIWGSLMHYLIYAEVCSPSDCYKPLFDVLIGSNKCDINIEFKPEDTVLKTGEEVPVERIMANGTALSFALEMAKCEHYSEELIKMGADFTTINWDNIFFAPEKVKSLKMLSISGSPPPDYFREYSDPSFDTTIRDEEIEEYSNEFNKFIEWLDKRKTTPLSLKQTARNSIRKAIGSTGCRKLVTNGSQIFRPQFDTFPSELSDYIVFNSYEDFE